VVNLKNMEPTIIFQDSDLLVIEKPAGWITNEADTTRNVPVLQKWLKENLQYEISKKNNAKTKKTIASIPCLV